LILLGTGFLSKNGILDPNAQASIETMLISTSNIRLNLILKPF